MVPRPSLGVIGDALIDISRLRMRWMRFSFLRGHIITRDEYDQNSSISVFDVICCYIESSDMPHLRCTSNYKFGSFGIG